MNEEEMRRMSMAGKRKGRPHFYALSDGETYERASDKPPSNKLLVVKNRKCCLDVFSQSNAEATCVNVFDGTVCP